MIEIADVQRTVVEANSETKACIHELQLRLIKMEGDLAVRLIKGNGELSARLIELKGELKDIKFAVVLNLVLWLLFFLLFVGKFTATR